MGFFRIDGTLTGLSAEKQLYNDFAIYDHLAFRQIDGSEKRLENDIGVPIELDALMTPSLQGRFYAYSIGFLGRRGLFAVRTQKGERRAVFKVPGEGMLLPLGIFCVVTVLFIPFAIILLGRHAGVRKAKREAEEAWKADGN